jgi:hypothetical protein
MPQGPAWVPARQTDGLAIASLVCSCVGIIPFLLGVPCILGVIFGFVSRGKIKRSHGALKGEGLALAGIIVGFSLIGIFVLFVVLVVIFVDNHTCTGNSVRFDCGVN